MKATTATVGHLGAHLVIVVVILTVAHRADLRASAAFTELDSSPDYDLEWIGEPNRTEFDGKEFEIAGLMDTDSGEGTVIISKVISTTFTIKKGAELEIKTLLSPLNLKLGFSVQTSMTDKTTTSYKLPVRKHAKGIAMFREKLVHIQGRARKTYKTGFLSCIGMAVLDPKCLVKTKDIDIDVVTAKLDKSGGPMGTYWMKYIEIEKTTAPEFFNLQNRTIDLAHGDEIFDGDIISPYDCAKQALAAHFDVAVFEVDSSLCFVKKSTYRNGTTYNNVGNFLGEYSLVDKKDKFTKDQSRDFNDLDPWIKEKRCDVIHSIYGPPREGQENQLHVCKKFTEKARSVVMFKRDKREWYTVNKATRTHKQSSAQSTKQAWRSDSPADQIQAQPSESRPLSWIGSPMVKRFEGEKRTIYGHLSTGEQAMNFTLIKPVKHTFRVNGQLPEVDTKALKRLAERTLKYPLKSLAEGRVTEKIYMFPLEKKSNVSVLFSPQLIHLVGRARSESGEFPINLTMTALDEAGGAQGSFSLDFAPKNQPNATESRSSGHSFTEDIPKHLDNVYQVLKRYFSSKQLPEGEGNKTLELFHRADLGQPNSDSDKESKSSSRDGQ